MSEINRINSQTRCLLNSPTKTRNLNLSLKMSLDQRFEDLYPEQKSFQIMERTSSSNSSSPHDIPIQLSSTNTSFQNVGEMSKKSENEKILLEKEVQLCLRHAEVAKIKEKEMEEEQSEELLLKFQGQKEELKASLHQQSDLTSSESEVEGFQSQMSKKVFKVAESKRDEMNLKKVLLEEKVKILSCLTTNLQQEKKKEENLSLLGQVKDLTKKENYLLACNRVKPKKKSTISQQESLIFLKDEQVEVIQEQKPAAIPECSQLPLQEPEKKVKQEPFVMACQRINKIKMKQKKATSKVKQPSIREQEEAIMPQEKENEQLANDGEFQEFFRTCKFKEEIVKCKQGFKAEMVCVESICQNSAYICSNKICQSCPILHKDCNLCFTISMLTKTLNKNVERQRMVAQQIFSFGSSIIEQVLKTRKTLQRHLCFQGIELDKIAEKTDRISLKSCDILNIFESFKKQENNDAIKLKKIKEKFRQDQELMKSILSMEVKFALEPLRKEELAHLPTHLVHNKSEIKFILKNLNFPTKFELVYRASQNDFNISKYHQLCDNLDHTFTIIKTEHEKLIGGYTPLKLQKSDKDKSNKTFLLAINLKEKLEHIRSGEGALYFDRGMGPCFGKLFEKYDIEVFEENGQLRCQTNFPNMFNWKKQFKSSQESWRFLTGVEYGQKCRVVDFEVFKVRTL